MSAVSFVAGLVLLLGGSSCASKPPLAMRSPDFAITPARLAVMEASVAIYQLGDAQAYPRREWTAAAQKHLDWALAVRAKNNGATWLNRKELDEDEYTLFATWADRSLFQISARIKGVAYPDVKSVTQWRYNRTLEPWRAQLGADHVLVARFIDGHSSAGQAILDAMAGVEWIVRRGGVACVVSLASGRMVWCAHNLGARDDVRRAASAKIVVDQLVADILPK